MKSLVHCVGHIVNVERCAVKKASEKFGGRVKGTQAFNFTTAKGRFS